MVNAATPVCGVVGNGATGFQKPSAPPLKMTCAPEGSVESLLRRTVPWLSCSTPVKVLLPVSASAPGPTLTSVLPPYGPSVTPPDSTTSDAVPLVVIVLTVPGPEAVCVLLNASGAVRIRSELLLLPAVVKNASPSNASGLLNTRGPSNWPMPKASRNNPPPAKLMVPEPSAPGLFT